MPKLNVMSPDTGGGMQVPQVGAPHVSGPQYQPGDSFQMGANIKIGNSEQKHYERLLEYEKKAEENRQKIALEFRPKHREQDMLAIKEAMKTRLDAAVAAIPTLEKISLAKHAREFALRAGAEMKVQGLRDAAHKAKTDLPTLMATSRTEQAKMDRQAAIEAQTLSRMSAATLKGTLAAAEAFVTDPALMSELAPALAYLGYDPAAPVLSAPSGVSGSPDNPMQRAPSFAIGAGSSFDVAGPGAVLGQIGEGLGKLMKGDASSDPEYLRKIGGPTSPAAPRPAPRAAPVIPQSDIRPAASSADLDKFMTAFVGKISPHILQSDNKRALFEALLDGTMSDDDRTSIWSKMNDGDRKAFAMDTTVAALALDKLGVADPLAAEVAGAEASDAAGEIFKGIDANLGAAYKETRARIQAMLPGTADAGRRGAIFNLYRTMGNRLASMAALTNAETETDMNRLANRLVQQGYSKTGVALTEGAFTLAQGELEYRAGVDVYAANRAEMLFHGVVSGANPELLSDIVALTDTHAPNAKPYMQRATARVLAPMLQTYLQDERGREKMAALGITTDKVQQLAGFGSQMGEGTVYGSFFRQLTDDLRQVQADEHRLAKEAGQPFVGPSKPALTYEDLAKKYIDPTTGEISLGQGSIDPQTGQPVMRSIRDALAEEYGDVEEAQMLAESIEAHVQEMLTPSAPIIDAPTRLILESLNPPVGQKAPAPPKPKAPADTADRIGAMAGQAEADLASSDKALAGSVESDVSEGVEGLLSAPVPVQDTGNRELNSQIKHDPIPGAGIRTSWADWQEDRVNKSMAYFNQVKSQAATPAFDRPPPAPTMGATASAGGTQSPSPKQAGAQGAGASTMSSRSKPSMAQAQGGDLT